MSDFKLVKLLGSAVNISFPGVITYRGVYAGATAYVIGDSVSYNGSSYVALGATTGNLPTNATFWQLLAAQGATGPAGSYGYTPANDSLSNLAVTSINTDLLPISSDTYNIGNTGVFWNTLFTKEIGVEGANFINVFTRKLFSEDSQESANFQSRYLSDSASALSVDYQNRLLKDGSNLKAMDWQSRQAYDRAEIQSIHFEDRILYANDGATSVLNWSQVTGPTTITQAANDNSTNIATTAYVDSGLSLKEPTLTASAGLTKAGGALTNNLSTGVAGGQTIIGGLNAANNLVLSTTSNASKGKIFFGSNSAYQEANIRLGIGTSTPSASIQVNGVEAATVTSIIRGFTSQTANLTEWQNSLGTVVSQLSVGGRFATNATLPGLDDSVNTANYYLAGNRLIYTASSQPVIDATSRTLKMTTDRGAIIVYGSGGAGATGPIIDYDINSNATAGFTFARLVNGTLSGALSGNNNAVSISPTYNPAAGAGNFRALDINYTNNASGAQTGISYGLRINRNTSGTAFPGANDILLDAMYGGSSMFRVDANGVRSFNTMTVTDLVVGTTGNVGKAYINTGATATVGLTVRGVASQTAKLQEWQSSASTVLASIDPAGFISIGASVANPTTGSLVLSRNGGQFFVENTAGALNEKLWDILNNTTTLRWRAVNDANNAATNYFEITRTGITINSVCFPNGNVGIGTSSPGASLQINVPSSAIIGSIIRGANSQTANLTQWQDSSAAILLSVTSAGKINVVTANTATTVGAVGTASALPALPLGYIIAQVNGTDVKIPYYNN